MSVLGKVVRAGVGRRRIQSTVLVLTTLAAVTASVLSVGLLVAAKAPFDRAFATRSGAHLTAQFDGAKTTAAQAAATGQAAGVTQSAGPYRIAGGLPYQFGPDCSAFPDGLPTPSGQMPPITVAGRIGAPGSLDRLAKPDAGHWPAADDEIAMTDFPENCLGKTITFPTLTGKPAFKVVSGGADSVTESADAWVTPAGLDRLVAAGAAANWQMFYRFGAHDTDAQLTADRRAIAAAAPAGTLLGSQSYLDKKREITGNINVFVPFLVVFGVLGLFLSVLIIAIVVSGAVVSALRRIGVLKALGFTPGQVARAYVAQALIPAGVGSALGVVCADLLAGPVLNGGSRSLGMPRAEIPLWVYAGVPAALLAVVTVTALVPALRAGRLRAAATLAAGRAAGVGAEGRGRTARRVAGRLPVPRPVSLGLAQPFARPARTVTVAAAVVFGMLSATFALGLESGFAKFQDVRTSGTNAGAVQVMPKAPDEDPAKPGSGPHRGGPRAAGPGQETIADPAAVGAALAAQPGTAGWFGFGRTQASVPGAAITASVTTVEGDMSWARYPILHGRWFAAAGEAVIADRLATADALSVGDTITVTDQGRSIPLRIVGVDFDLNRDGMGILTPAGTYTALGLTPAVEQFQVRLAAGTDLQQYLATVNPALANLGVEADGNGGRHKSDVVLTMSALVLTLTLMLVVVAALGVLNTVVQDTRERVHEIGVFKALGMTPKQTVVMVLTSVTGTGLLAGLVGVPLGMMVEHLVMPAMGNAVSMHLPPAVTDVYGPGLVGPLLAGGLLIAAAGALLPAGWAARTRTATALRSE